MRFLGVKLVTLTLVVSSLAVVTYAQSTTSPLRFEPLPVQRLFPLMGEQCSCFIFRKGSALTDETVIFSTTALSGRILVEKREHELANTNWRHVNKTLINTYSASDVTVSVASTEVPFKQACSTYPSPPNHGSCFVGTMNLRKGNRTATSPVVQLCGC